MTPETINLIQAFNNHIPGMSEAICPSLEDYPETVDQLSLPITLTEFENTVFWGRPNNKYAEGSCVVRMLFMKFGNEIDLGWIRTEVAEYQTAFQDYYLDTDNNYLVKGQFVFQKSPVRIEIVSSESMFNMSGYKILEYPELSGFWFHGFELRFQVRETWPSTCVRTVT